MTAKRASARAAGTKSASNAEQGAAPPHAPQTPQPLRALTPVATPPALGAPRLEVVASPFRVLRVTLRLLEYQELPGGPSAAPAAAPADALSTGTQLVASVTLFVEGAEVALDVHVAPDPARMPVKLRAAFSAFLARPDGMGDEQFVSLAGEIGPRLVLPYVRQVITQTTALGLYGPLNLDLMNVRVVWEGAGGQ